MISLLPKYVNELTYDDTKERHEDEVKEAYQTLWKALSCRVSFPSPVPQ